MNTPVVFAARTARNWNRFLLTDAIKRCVVMTMFLVAGVAGVSFGEPSLHGGKHFTRMTVCRYAYDCLEGFCSNAGYNLGPMVRRNAAGTKLYLYCIKGETHSVLAVDGTGAINEIACPEPCTDLVLDSEEGIVGWYNFALQTLTTKDEKHSLTNVVAFKHDRKGEYFAYKSGSEPTSIRISSFSAPESVLAHTEYTGAFDIFSNDKNVFVTVTEGFGRPLNFFRYAIESNMITLTEKRAILHPKSKGIVRPALHPLDMDVDAEVLLCTLEYDCPLAALSRMYLFDISSGEFSSQVQTQGRSFLLQQCVPLCVTDSSSPKSPAR